MTQEIKSLLKDYYSEEWRKECEARFVISMPLVNRRKYLADVEEKRGEESRVDLEQEILRLWQTKKKR